MPEPGSIETTLGQVVSNNQGLKEMRDILQKLLLEEVGISTKHKDQSEKSSDKLQSTLEDFKKLIEGEIKDQEKFAKDVIQVMKDTQKATVDVGKKVVKSASDVLKGAVSTGGIGGGKGGTLTSKLNIDNASEAGAKAAKDFSAKFKDSSKKALSGWFATMGAVMGGGQDFVSTLMQGIFAEQITFEQNVRQIQHEIQGITKETREADKSWGNIGETVAETGTGLVKFQTIYLKQLRTGIKSQKETLSVTKAGVSLSKMIGSNTEQTADLFHDWHRTLGLNSNQMAQVARNVQDVARLTGVTGDNLLDVVKKSEQFMKNMRNAGTLTAGATKQIMLLVAEAKKLGIEEQMSTILDAATSSANLFFKASKETQNLLFQVASSVGKTRELVQGTFLRGKQGQRDLAEGLDNLMRSYGASFDQLANLTDEQLKNMNLALFKGTGYQIGELERIREAAQIAGLSLAENYKRLTKQMRNNNLTAKEQLQAGKERQAQLLSTGFEFMTKFDEIITKSAKGLKGGQLSMEEASKQMRKSLSPEQFKDIAFAAEKAGISINEASSNIEVMQAMSSIAAKQLKEAGGKDFTKDMQAAIAKGDGGKIREVLAKMNEEQRKLNIAERMALDPVTEAGFYTKLMNEKLAGISSTLMWGFAGMIGPLGIIVAQLALVAGSMMFSSGGGMMFKSLSKFFRGGAGKAATTGAGTATQVALMSGQAAPAAAAGGGRVAQGMAKLGSSLKVVGQFAKVAAKPLIVLGAAIAVTEGFFQALKSGTKAAEIFGVAQEKVTGTQKMAAESAGFYTGILNGLTFGIFKKALGPTGSLTKALAKLYAIFPPLMLGAQLILIPLKALWGILKGLWYFIKESFIGIWEGIKIAAEPFVEIFNEVKTIFADIFSPISDLFGGMDEGIGIVSILSTTLKYFGKMVGFAFKMLGWAIKIVLWPFVMVIKGLVKVLKPIIEWFKGLIDVIVGIFTLDFKKIMSGLMQMFKAVFVGIPGLFFDAIKSVFIDFPIWLWKGFKSALTKVWEWIKSWVPTPKKIWETVKRSVGLGGKKEGEEGPGFWSNVWEVTKTAAGATAGFVVGGPPGAIAGGLIGAALQAGTPEILDTGSALLHRGEMVIPAEAAGQMRAEAPGSFFGATGRSLLDMLTGGLLGTVSPITENIDDIAARERAGAGDRGGGLSSIERTNAKQVSLQEEIRAGINKLVELFESVAGGSTVVGQAAPPGGRAGTDRVPLPTAFYGEWQFSKYANPGMQIINDGT